MNDDFSALITEYPDYISKEQLRIICHISKRTALYLLQSSLIPCTDNGKRTHKYKTSIHAVITYLKDREISPEKYKPPQDWYSGIKVKRQPNIELPDISQEKLTEYYEMLFAHYPDVLSKKEALTVADVSENTLLRWIKEKKFRAFLILGKYQIPKISLIEYMVTAEYRKRLKQKNDYIGGFIKWQGQLS